MYDSESSSDGGWISWFCDLEGHEFFVEVRDTEIKALLVINAVWLPLGGRRLYQGLIQLIWTERARAMPIQVSVLIP